VARVIWCVAPLLVAPALAATPDRIKISVQPKALSFVRDLRTISVSPELKTITLDNISRELRPETLLVRFYASEKDIHILEEKLETEPVTYQNMLRYMMGSNVKYAESDPDLGREVMRQGRLLATEDDGLIIQTDRKVDTHVQGRVQFDHLPEGLSADPAMRLSLSATKTGPQQVELSYLTPGFDWAAHYVAEVNEAEDLVDFYGYVALANRTNMNLKEALFDLIAPVSSRVSADVRAAERVVAEMAAADKSTAKLAEASGALVSHGVPSTSPSLRAELKPTSFMASEAPHYPLSEPVSLKAQETKRVVLLRVQKVKGHRQFWVRLKSDPFQDENGFEAAVPVLSVVSLQNRKGALPGHPLPEGTLTVFRRSLNGQVVLQDLSRLPEVAPGGQVAMTLGRAEGIEAKIQQSDFKKLGERVVEVSYRIDIKNSRKSPAQIKVVIDVPRDIQILRETHPHTSENQQSLVWALDVPPTNQTELRYRMRATY